MVSQAADQPKRSCMAYIQYQHGPEVIGQGGYQGNQAEANRQGNDDVHIALANTLVHGELHVERHYQGK